MSTTNPKVVHLPLEIAGQAGLICEYLRNENFKAYSFNYFESYLQYSNVWQTESYELIKVLDKFIDYYDIFHFHNGHTVMTDFSDIDMINKAGKKMIMHHRGNDVRFKSLASKGKGYVNPYVKTNNYLSDEEIKDNLELFSESMDAAIVQDNELYKYVIDYYRSKGKPVYVLPRLINSKVIKPLYPQITTKKPTIVHAPTDRAFKGSDIIEETLEKLKADKISFDYISIEGKSHKDALKYYRKADIVIDQILCGSYGNVSVEAMAMGKPVICYIRPDLEKMYGDKMPIISANPDNLYQKLKALITEPEERFSLGKKGRAYVEEHHEGSRIIKDLIKIYQEVLETNVFPQIKMP
ncbi:glycosyltransferase [Alkaliphilus transvaalensis]|uniref:glycosyltransferase n=1 Tax=Alkaliphilus transvaalensis TaxID=114628 RepID=UPI00068460DE|nr:glycosyltransferase [Alkaliphilus transvaalensis]